jgi:hypothetical protein
VGVGHVGERPVGEVLHPGAEVLGAVDRARRVGLDAADRVRDRWRRRRRACRDREHLGLDAVQLLPAPRVGLVEVDLGAEVVAGVAGVLLAPDRLLVPAARGELLLEERRELGERRARGTACRARSDSSEVGYVARLRHQLREDVAAPLPDRPVQAVICSAPRASGDAG